MEKENSDKWILDPWLLTLQNLSLHHSSLSSVSSTQPKPMLFALPTISSLAPNMMPSNEGANIFHTALEQFLFNHPPIFCP